MSALEEHAEICPRARPISTPVILAVDVLVDLIKDGRIDFKKYEKVSDKDLERQIKKIAEKNKGASFGAMMGEAMRLFKGKAEPKKISEFVKKYSV